MFLLPLISPNYSNDSITEFVDGDILFCLMLPFILFVVYVLWRVRRVIRIEEMQARLLKLKRKILRRKEE
jgi:hypothetical protein